MSSRVKSASVRGRRSNAEGLSEERDGELTRPRIEPISESSIQPTSFTAMESAPVQEGPPQLRPYADHCVANKPVYGSMLSRNRKEPLSCTKLSGTLPHCTSGHVPGAYERNNHMKPEYNGLHDPHLRSYFHQPQMRENLIKNGYVTEDLRVVCPSLKDYQSYQDLQEIETMELTKTVKEYQAEQSRREKLLATETKRRKQESVWKEEKTKHFLNKEAQKQRTKEIQLCTSKEVDLQTKLKALEERQSQWKGIEKQRDIEEKQRKLNRHISEHEAIIHKKSLLRQCEEDERLRDIHISQMKKEKRSKRHNVLVKRWEKYDEHVQEAKEYQRERKAEAEKDRENKVKQHKNTSIFSRKRQEERQTEQREENRRQIDELKEKADYLEKKRQERKENEVCRYKESIQRKLQCWDNVVTQRKEATKRDQEKHFKKLFHRVHLPSVTTRHQRIWRRFGTPKPVSTEKSDNHSHCRSTVQFSDKLIVHIFKNVSEESFSDDDDDDDDDRALSGDSEEDLEAADVADLNHNDSYDIQLKKSQD